MALLFVVIAGWIYLALPAKEPFHNGKPLSYWLMRYEGLVGQTGEDGDDPEVRECREAIRQIGTNAIPLLLQMLRAKDSALKSKFMDLVERQDYIRFHFAPAAEQNFRAVQGFWCLNDLATNSIPALVQIYTHAPSPLSKDSADSALKGIYPASAAVTPYWVEPQKWAEWYNEAGQIKSHLGADSNAVLAFSEAIKLNPTNAVTYLNRASSRMRLEDFAGALSDAKKTIELDDRVEGAILISGLCHYGLKDFKSAEADFTTSIGLNTNDVNAYTYRGMARANLRKLDEALADFNRAIEFAPRESACYRNRSLVEVLQKDYELALEDASRAIGLNGKDPFAYVSRGYAMNALKDYAAAVRDFDKAVELNPKDAGSYAARGEAKVLMDDFMGAGADLEKALQLDPDNAFAYTARGWLRVKRGGEADDALADFQRATELGAQMPETHAMLGMYQYLRSDWGPALANCRKALELGAVIGATELRCYIWLIRAQLGEEQDASRELEMYLQSQHTKTNEWEACIARFLAGSVMESNFLSQATTTAKRPSDLKGQVCDSLYYAGMKRKIAGDKTGALDLFQKCLGTKENNNLGYMNARAEIRALTDE
jgi:tetratricopeptide (TPR) repeat protein